MRFRIGLISLCILFVACAGCAAHAPLRAEASADWVKTELFFAIGERVATPEQDAADERRWQTFLDAEVTPRFPDGLSVFDVSGQWRSAARMQVHHEHSKSIMIVYHDNAQRSADIDAIRAAWKKLSGAESVLRITQHVNVAF